MRKINLKTKETSRHNASNNSGPAGQISLFAGLILLLLTVVSSGASYYLTNNQKKQIKNVKAEITSLKRSLDSNGEFKEVYDFQDRLLEIEKIVPVKISQVGLLNTISQSTINEVTLNLLEVAAENGISKVKVGVKSIGLADLAKQINGYRQINDKEEVYLKSSAVKEGILESQLYFNIISTNNETNDSVATNDEKNNI